MTNNNQTKSRQRVADHGEVFTSEREVNAMLDLVKHETERIDSRFLEPACGTGNFLAEILRRKLKVVKERYKKSKSDYDKYSIVALSSIYGVDLLKDNIEECQERLFIIFRTEYKKNTKEEMDSDYEKVVRYILSKNILHGDALTMLTIDNEPIIFPEWSLISGDMIKRRDFKFDDLLKIQEDQRTIFMHEWGYDEEQKVFIPSPVNEYQLMDYRRLYDEE